MYSFALADGGITFKLVKSNSCSSRLELAGATEIDDEHETEETEVVRKMVHHFEASAMKQPAASSSQPVESTLTINNQITATTATFNSADCCRDNEHQLHAKADDTRMMVAPRPHSQVIDEKYHDCGIKLVTVNNHINIAKGNSTESTKKSTTTTTATSNDLLQIKDKDEDTKIIFKKDDEKMYQTEAKDIYLDNNGGGGNGYGNAICNKKDLNGETACKKICRNKNVDLAFTFVKQPIATTITTTTTTTKSPGINTVEIIKNNTHIGKQTSTMNNNNKNKSNNPIQDNDITTATLRQFTTYENTLLPTITATANVRNINHNNNNNNMLSIKDRKANEINDSKSNSPSQFVVPIEIHRADDNNQTPKESKNLKSSSTKTMEMPMEKPYQTLSGTSSVTSVIDQTVVKYYVANDKSIYEKRKYDDIEFEEFEIYDPTKDFEKLIEEEQKRNNPDISSSNNTNSNTTFNTNTDSGSCLIDQQNQQHSTLCSTTSSMSTSTSTSSSSVDTSKSQQTTITSTTETETDCYDSLDDKL